MEDNQKLIDYTSDQYHLERHPEFLGSPELFDAWSYFAMEEYIRNFNPSSVLEVGGAFGWNLVCAARSGISCEMVEPSVLGRNEAQRRGIYTYASIEEIAEKKFDLILLRHVLEHIDNPLEMLNCLRKKLTQGGSLELVLPVESMYEAPDPHDKNFHLYCWNPQTIVNLLTRSGFSSVRWRYSYSTGRRRLMPLWNRGLRDQYVGGLRLLGRVLNARELIVVAQDVPRSE